MPSPGTSPSRSTSTNKLFTLSLVTILFVFSTLFDHAATQRRDEQDQQTPPIPKTHQPKSYFDILDDVRKIKQLPTNLEDSPFASLLRQSMLDYHRLGYQPIVTDLLSELTPTDELLFRGEPFNDSSPSSTHRGTFQGVSDLYRDDPKYQISQQCINDTLSLLGALSRLEKWTIPFLDSTGKPGPSITQVHLNFPGNYDMCRSSAYSVVEDAQVKGFKGNYCVVKAALPAFPIAQVQWGVCVPDSCSDLDLTVATYMAVYGTGLNSTFIPLATDCHTDHREYTAATIAAITFICVIGLLMVFGSIYDILVIQMPKWSSGKGLDKEGVMQSASINIENEKQTLVPRQDGGTRMEHGVCIKVLLAFSVYTNASKVLSTSQGSGSLSAIHGIRFLSMTWVILGHMYVFGLSYFANVTEMEVYLKRWTFAAVANAFPSVDTFFTLSGLLTSYLTIKHMASKTWKINWGMFYFHRFWRLTPPYMLALVVILGLTRFLGSGATWATTQPSDKQFCEDNWWTNLLYINNLVKDKEMCLGHSWYLANDMQFFIISPLLMIPFYFNKWLGMLVCSIVLLSTWIVTGVLSTIRLWGVSMLTADASKIGTGNTWFNEYYIVPWCRVGPYVIGIMAGYLLAVTRGGKEIKMNGWAASLGWVVAGASGLAIVYGLEGDLSGENPSSVGAAALYNAVARSVWGLCIAWVIIACAAGYGGPVNKLLSWSPFVFLGKLTYMSYLIHPTIIMSFMQNMEVPFYLTVSSMVITFLGILVFVNMTAFVLMLAFESPMIVLEKIFIRKDSS